MKTNNFDYLNYGDSYETSDGVKCIYMQTAQDHLRIEEGVYIVEKRFKYPMWFKSTRSKMVVKFTDITEGEVVVPDLEEDEEADIGFFSYLWAEHTETKHWTDVTDQYKDKIDIPPLKMCGTPFSVKEKDTEFPTIKETLENIFKVENKYKRKVPSTEIDIYDILKAFNVVNPAVQHAVKKLLCAGDRGYKDKVQDLKEALASIERAIELEGDNV